MSVKHSATHHPISVSAIDAAKMLGLSKSTIYSYMSDGTIPYVKFGRRRMIMVRDLETLASKFRHTERCREGEDW